MISRQNDDLSDSIDLSDPQTSPHSDTGLKFHAKPGWLLQAAQEAGPESYLLVIDEINRGDLGKALDEAIYLFEPGEVGGADARDVHLPHAVNGSQTAPAQPVRAGDDEHGRQEMADEIRDRHRADARRHTRRTELIPLERPQ